MAASPDTENLVGELESLLSCPICFETLNDPRTLPCFHSFCRACLEEFVEKFVEKQREKFGGKQIEDFNCPTCRTPFTVKTEDGVAKMSGSHFIRNMIEVMAIQHQTKVAVCSQCGQPSACRCVDCEMFMCKECLSVHEKWPAFKKHSVLSMEELSKPENETEIKARLHCNEHKKKKLKFYCETCKELICRYCMDFNHVRPDHLCSPIEKVAEKHREAMKSCFKNLEEKLVQGNQALQAITNASQALKDSAEEVKNQINQHKEKIKQKLEQQAQRKIGEVDGLYKDTDEQITLQMNELKSFVDKVKEFVNLASNLLEKGNDEEIITSQKMIEERVDKLEREFPKRLEPVHDGKIQYNTVPTETNLEVATLGEVVCQPVYRSTEDILIYTSLILKDKEGYAEQMVEGARKDATRSENDTKTDQRRERVGPRGWVRCEQESQSNRSKSRDSRNEERGERLDSRGESRGESRRKQYSKFDERRDRIAAARDDWRRQQDPKSGERRSRVESRGERRGQETQSNRGFARGESRDSLNEDRSKRLESSGKSPPRQEVGSWKFYQRWGRNATACDHSCRKQDPWSGEPLSHVESRGERRKQESKPEEFVDWTGQRDDETAFRDWSQRWRT